MNWLNTRSQGDWNQMRVKAQGNLIQIWLNGFKTVHYTEKEPTNKIPRNGHFGLQIIVDLQPNAGIGTSG